MSCFPSQAFASFSVSTGPVMTLVGGKPVYASAEFKRLSSAKAD